MNGLDRIIEQIKKESDEAVKKIMSDAEKKALKNKQRIIKETEKQKEDIKAKTKAECEDIIKRGKSSAALAEKQTMLNAKQKIITETVNKAHAHLLSLQSDEYFAIIEKMITSYAHSNEKGEIAFNENDINRLPKGFERKISKLSANNLTLSDRKVDIDGGFLLIYGGIEENCSFNAIFSEKHDQLQDEVCTMLFS